MLDWRQRQQRLRALADAIRSAMVAGGADPDLADQTLVEFARLHRQDEAEPWRIAAEAAARGGSRLSR